MKTLNLVDLSEEIRKETGYDFMDHDINDFVDVDTKTFSLVLTKIWEDADKEDDYFYTDSVNTYGEKEEEYSVYLDIVSDIPLVDGRIENTLEALQSIIVKKAC